MVSEIEIEIAAEELFAIYCEQLFERLEVCNLGAFDYESAEEFEDCIWRCAEICATLDDSVLVPLQNDAEAQAWTVWRRRYAAERWRGKEQAVEEIFNRLRGEYCI